MRRLLAPGLAAALAGCAAPPAHHPGLAPGARLADLPAGYALVLGRLRLTRDGREVPCPAAPGAPACGLALRYESGDSFLVPYSGVPAALPELGAPAPFFALRLPAGAYRVTHVEAPPGGHRPLAAPRRFRAGAGEVLYVGSVEVDLSGDPARPARSKVADERDEAARVAAELDPAAPERFVARPME